MPWRFLCVVSYDFLLTIKLHPEFLTDTNNLTNRSIWFIDDTLTGTTALVQGEIAIKRYFTLRRAPKLEPHHKIKFVVILWTPLFCEGLEGRSYTFFKNTMLFLVPPTGCLFLVRFGLFFFFNGISTFVGYLMPKPFSSKNSSGTI